MFKWLTNKMIDNYIKSKVKELKEIDVREKVLEYINAHKEEVIEKAKKAIEKFIKTLVAKVVQEFKNKV